MDFLYSRPCISYVPCAPCPAAPHNMKSIPYSMDICSICQEEFKPEKGDMSSLVDVVLVKHRTDQSITQSRKRAHYFHSACIEGWKAEYSQRCTETFKGDICPLDRDLISSCHRVKSYAVGFDLSVYNNSYRELLLSYRVVPEKLLEKIVDIDEVDNQNKTLAYYACQYGNYVLVERLLKRKADFNRGTGDHNFTPLMAAVCSGHYEIIKRLLSNKVVRLGCGVQDQYGKTAFTYGCEARYVGIITEFLNHDCVNTEEVRHNLIQFSPAYHRDKMYGYELISKMHYYLRKHELRAARGT